MHWFTLDWWKHVLRKSKSDVPWILVVICRIRNHPKGVIWYNPNGYEPNMCCKYCDDDLG